MDIPNLINTAINGTMAALAVRQTRAAERSVAATEAMQPDPPAPVVWRFERGPRQGHLLRNVGEKPATHIVITGLGHPETSAEQIRQMVRCEIPDRVDPQQAIQVNILEYDQATVDTLKIYCAETATVHLPV